MCIRLLSVIAIILLSSGVPAYSEEPDLFSLDLKDLLKIQVESQRFGDDYRRVSHPISVISQEQIQNYQIDSVYDLAYVSPNLSFRRSFGRWQERPALRGVSAITGTPAVGILIDGVKARDIAPTLALHDVEHVEVLRGPQAALFGRATFGGAVNFVSRRPSAENERETAVRLGNNGLLDADFWLNKRVNEQLSFAVSGRFYQRGDIYKNQLGTGGASFGSEESNMVSAMASWDLSPELRLFYKGTLQFDRDGLIPVYLQNSASNNCFLTQLPNYYCGEIDTPSTIGFSRYPGLWDYFLDKNIQRHHLELSHSAGRFETKFIVNQNSSDVDSQFDGDFYELDSLFFGSYQDLTTRSVEYITNYRDGHINIVAGLSFSEEKQEDSSESYFLFGGELSSLDSESGKNNVKNYAAFSSFEYSFLDDVSLKFDLRYAVDQLSYSTISDPGMKDDWESFSPRITLEKSLGDRHLVYASVSVGNQPGGFNDDLSTLNFESDEERQRVERFLRYDEESLKSYDVGFKGELNEDRLFFSLDAFYSEWGDMQIIQSLSYRNESSEINRESTRINGGKARTLGYEAELESVLSSRLRARIGLGYVNATYRDASTSAQEDLTGEASIDDRFIPNIPKKTAFLGVSFRQPLNSGYHIAVDLSGAYESRRYVAEHNYAHIPSTTKVNFSLNLVGDQWRAGLWGKNIGNDDAPESVARFGDAASFFTTRAFAITLPEERQYGLNITYDF